MIERRISSQILEAAIKMPVIVVTGPRQSGKSTLIRHLFPDHKYLNLEDLEQRAFAKSDPKGFLQQASGKIILDEVQNVPDLLSYVQVLSDQDDTPGRYVLSGSQNLLIMQAISQSLAGRAAIFNLLPLALEEIQGSKFEMISYEEYLFKGFYPRIYDRDLNPTSWLQDYIKTYVERDVRQLLNVGDLNIFRQFLEICAGRIGQLVNFSEIGNQIGVSYQTIKHWLSVLETSFILYTLRPYHNNFNKRIVKSPKLYFYDTGLACALLNLRSIGDLNSHFAKGAMFENFVINEIFKNQINRNISPKNYFWNAAGSHEIDLLLDKAGKLSLIEIKSSRTIGNHFFDGLAYFQKLSGSLSGESYLVYGGDEIQNRSNCQVISWKNLEEIPF